MNIQNQGFDHVEFSVSQLAKVLPLFERMGFEQTGERKTAGSRSILLGQGWVRILLNEAKDPTSASHQFQKVHGDGICVLALDVDDARAAFAETVGRGARPAMEPKVFENEFGKVVRSEIYAPSDLRYAFIERHSKKERALFDQDLVAERLESPSPFGIRVIDHLTNNVSIGEMAKWVSWYKQVFDFEVVRHFDIRTGRTGLISDVVRSKNGKITVPINEATEKESQVQEFVDRFHGPGVQHLAFLTTDIVQTVGELNRKEFKFLKVPPTYYQEVPKRVPQFDEDLSVLQELSVLLDGEGGGYLLQIFTGELMGPFFLEFIQRKGNQGFGEGNFRALFEAIERDQVARGVLKPTSS